MKAIKKYDRIVTIINELLDLDLRKKSRRGINVMSRDVAAFLIKTYYNKGWEQTARIVGHKSHSATYIGVKRCRYRLDEEVLNGQEVWSRRLLLEYMFEAIGVEEGWERLNDS